MALVAWFFLAAEGGSLAQLIIGDWAFYGTMAIALTLFVCSGVMAWWELTRRPDTPKPTTDS